MFDFEKLHRNQKLAYLDGVLCGVVGCVIITAIYKDYKEARKLERELEQIDKKNKN
jgi:hypothetical protein